MRLVIAARNDRIGARLSNLLCAWRFAKRSNAELMVLWSHLDSVTCNYSYDPAGLFDVDQMLLANGIRFYESISELIGELGHSFDHDRVFNAKSQSIVDSVRGIDDNNSSIILYTQTSPVPWPGDTANGHDTEISELFKRLSWSDEVRRALRDVESTLSIDNAVAVHVRRGDLISCCHTP
jgi:hypothetical protein